VEAHGGLVTATNRPRGGACFTVLVPVTPPAGLDGSAGYDIPAP
jgi:signal transduction histidine kinase